jgi:hypothetical protein
MNPHGCGINGFDCVGKDRMAAIFGINPERVIECTTLERCGQFADDF